MLFMVEQADHYNSFADYGLPDMAVTYNDEILTDIDEIEESEKGGEVYCRFSEIEINTLEELMEFIERVGCGIVIYETVRNDVSLKNKYKTTIVLYNDYLE
ncbi:MAG: hypothetical protein MJ197_10540 [Bacteroidales bacterium]|nr:hypothetical protein [Bacteroidales bacterium]